mmetsp:Transcript_16454/g.21524  ORF Transcript_16454/g.21524 Transcript_16454/m.21524 type:complete len:334 (+) Transcript_16454:56-1057(+)
MTDIDAIFAWFLSWLYSLFAGPTCSWVTGPEVFVKGSSADYERVSWSVPKGKIIRDYEVHNKSKGKHARYNIQYLAANSVMELNQANNKKDQATFGMNTAGEVDVVGAKGATGVFSATLDKRLFKEQQNRLFQSTSHQVIVLSASIGKGGWKGSTVDVKVRVLLEDTHNWQPIGLGGVIVAMLGVWITAAKKHGPWYEKAFGLGVRFTGNSVGGFAILLKNVLEAQHDPHQRQVKPLPLPFPYQSFGAAVIALVIVTAVTNYDFKKWVDEKEKLPVEEHAKNLSPLVTDERGKSDEGKKMESKKADEKKKIGSHEIKEPDLKDGKKKWVPLSK